MKTYNEEPMIDESINDNFFDTPELDVPKTPPDIHNAIITRVELKRIGEQETPVITIGLTSKDIQSLDDEMGIFVPKGYEDGVALGGKFDPKTLQQEESGEWFQKEQTMFSRSVANKDRSATLQVLVTNPDSIAQSAGRNPVELGVPRTVTSLDEYVEKVISPMLLGLDVKMVRRERGGSDPANKHRLQVKEIIADGAVDANPKKYKKYVKAWENA